MSLKIYLSGPIKDNDDFVQDFERGETELFDLYGKMPGGLVVFNPVKLGEVLAIRMEQTPTYAEYMADDIKYLLESHMIAMLPAWERSAGARCEHLVAVMCGLGVCYL